ncbi:hypothetical protein ACFLUV_04710 [Elusimicrobiota bacterium]
MLAKLKILLILLLLLPAIIQGEEDIPQIYSQAVGLYEEGNYKEAKKLFNKSAKEYSDTSWQYYSRIYIAKCWSKLGKKEKAFDELNKLLEEISVNELNIYASAMEELSDLGESKAINRIKELLSNSPVKDVRKKAAQLLGNVKEIDLKEHLQFLLDSLKFEKEQDIVKEISDSIYRLGSVDTDKVINMYKKADRALKEKLLYLFSKYDDEDMIMTLQEESERAAFSIKNYISWALATMDPYRFASSFKGKLKKEEDGGYILYSVNSKLKLYSPSLKQETTPEFEELVGKMITVYGVETEGGIIYTEVFQTK